MNKENRFLSTWIKLDQLMCLQLICRLIILGQKIQWQILSQYLVGMLADTRWISLLSQVSRGILLSDGGDQSIIFGFDIFNSRFFGGRNYWKVFLWWLDLSRDFFAVFKTIWRFMVVLMYMYDKFKWYQHHLRRTERGPVVWTPVRANPWLTFTLRFFFLWKAFFRIVFSILFRVYNHQIVDKEN